MEESLFPPLHFTNEKIAPRKRRDFSQGHTAAEKRSKSSAGRTSPELQSSILSSLSYTNPEWKESAQVAFLFFSIHIFF
jgi:hypothetical protein